MYKNEMGRSINIGGYQFQKGGELPSDIIIDRFKEAVSNEFLSLREIKDGDTPKASPVIDTEEEARKAAEAEAARKAEEDRLAAETEKARLAEEERLAAEQTEAAKKAEEDRLAAEAEQVRIAEEANKAEEAQRVTEEARLAEEEARKAAEAEKKNKK
jgi:membrane protein involved in colicin uptake